MVEWLKSATFDSWKTTFLGLLGAVGIIVQPIIASGQIPTAQQWELAALSALFGLVAKSH